MGGMLLQLRSYATTLLHCNHRNKGTPHHAFSPPSPLPLIHIEREMILVGGSTGHSGLRQGLACSRSDSSGALLRKWLKVWAQGKGISHGQGPSTAVTATIATAATATIATEELYTQPLYGIDVQLALYSFREIPIAGHAIVCVSATSTVETITMCIAADNWVRFRASRVRTFAKTQCYAHTRHRNMCLLPHAPTSAVSSQHTAVGSQPSEAASRDRHCRRFFVSDVMRLMRQGGVERCFLCLSAVLRRVIFPREHGSRRQWRRASAVRTAMARNMLLLSSYSSTTPTPLFATPRFCPWGR